MKKIMPRVFVVSVILMIWISGCMQTPLAISSTPTLAPPAATSTPKPSPKRMVVSILPYYDYQDIQIDVGNYSEELKAKDIQVLVQLAQEMAQKKELLTPEQMYVLAIRFYDLGDKDTSIYWYYEAQFRAKLFQQAIEPAQYIALTDQAFKLNTAYDDFTRMAGEYINGYAGCDLDNWVKFTQMVLADNTTPPALNQMFPDVLFVNENRWQSINDEVATGLAALIDYISKNGEAIKQRRAQQDMDAKYCN
ncbi:MAG: hypothetical protein QM730_28145 [Anaerolineales bacterium]